MEARYSQLNPEEEIQESIWTRAQDLKLIELVQQFKVEKIQQVHDILNSWIIEQKQSMTAEEQVTQAQ